MQNCLDAYSTDPPTTTRQPELGAGNGRGVGACDDQEEPVETHDQRSVLAAFALEDLGAPSITLSEENVGGKRPLTMEEIRKPDHLSRCATEARQEFLGATAAKRAKISESSQSVRIS